MDIKKTLLWAIFTISAILLFDGWQKHNGQPSLFASAPAKNVVAKADGLNKELPKVNAAGVPTANTVVSAKNSELLVLKNDVLELEIDTLGGVVTKAKLLKHLEEDKTPVVIFDRSATVSYTHLTLPTTSRV